MKKRYKEMKQNTVRLNGRTFTIHNESNKGNAMLPLVQAHSGRSLWECYSRPSVTKERIYVDWCEWSILNDVKSFGVCSYNTFGFSLTGVIQYGGHDYIMYITPSYNRLYKIK